MRRHAVSLRLSLQFPHPPDPRWHAVDISLREADIVSIRIDYGRGGVPRPVR